MKRMLIAALTLVAGAPAAHAFWLGELYCHLERGREENNLWPAQYVGQDRINASAPFDVMVRNGWRRQNLLGPHHFNEDCTRLTDAGKLRVQWILTQTPPAWRQVYVETALQDEVTANRLATVNEFAAMVVRDGVPPQAQPSMLVSEGRPAATVDLINTAFRENMPTPTLPTDSAPAPTE